MQQIDQVFCNLQHLAEPRFGLLRVVAVLAVEIVNSRKNYCCESDFQIKNLILRLKEKSRKLALKEGTLTAKICAMRAY
jgi:hypothetical protein